MDIEQIGINSLKAAFKKQNRLSKEKTIGTRVSKNAEGDTSLRGDIESEMEVIKVLKENKFPARIYAEEHGLINLSEKPRYLVVIDGFDGSSALAKDNKARGGTMLAISKSLNPRYIDFVFGGITDFSTNRIIYGLKDKGSFLYNNLYKNNQNIQKIEKFPLNHFDSKTKMYVDDPKYIGNYEEGITSQLDEISSVVRKNFTSKLEGRVELAGLISSGAMCMDLITGKVDTIGGISAKGVFEQPAEYVILKEVGGVITDYSGEDIGRNYWLKDRRLHKEYPIPSLRASSQQLAREIIKYLNKT